MLKRYKVALTAQAEKDIDIIWDYSAADSVENASRFVCEIEKRVALLNTFPERHPLIRENNYLYADYRHLIYGHYRIVYRITGVFVYIMRIIHGAQELR